MEKESVFRPEFFLVIPFYALMLILNDSQLSRAAFNISALLTAALLIRRKNNKQLSSGHSIFTGLLLIVYLSSSSLWSTPNLDDTYLRWGAGLAIFWVSAHIVALSSKDTLIKTAQAIGSITIAAATYNVFSYLLDPNAPNRNEGIGVTHHPIMGPSILLAMGATSIATLQFCKHQYRALLIALLASVGAYIITTGSRGPLLAFAAWTGTTFIFYPGARKIKISIMLIAPFFLILAATLAPEYISKLIERGTTHRIDIWGATIPLIQENLAFGKGIGFSFYDTPTSSELAKITGYKIEHPHNLGLSTALYSGVTGLFLLLITTIYGSGYLLLKKASKPLTWLPALLICLLFLSLTDLNRLVEPPTPIWFIFWFPFAMISGLATRVASMKDSEA